LTRIIRKRKIVLAEGELVIAEILPQLLKPIGYEVITASDGESALVTIKRELPDLIIIDSDLDKIDGFALCKILKSDFITSYVPIIILIEKRQIRKRLLEIQEGVDDYIIKPPDPIDLQVRLEMALRRTAHQVHANSLTRLPGNRAIESASRNRIDKEEPFSFLYLDIDQFKSFNDTYGYLRGDGVIMQTARILTDSVRKHGNKDDFVGHVGGDDFVIITTPQKESILAKDIIRQFDRLIPLHYSTEDRTIGYLSVKDRQDKDIKAPLMGISIAVVNNKLRKIKNVLELTEIAFEIKKHIKTIKGSKFLVNRRASGSENLSKNYGSDEEGSHVRALQDSKEALPIGQLLLKAKLITEEQLTEALFEHWSSRELLGQTLIKMGLISDEDLEPFLREYRKNMQAAYPSDPSAK